MSENESQGATSSKVGAGVAIGGGIGCLSGFVGLAFAVLIVVGIAAVVVAFGWLILLHDFFDSLFGGGDSIPAGLDEEAVMKIINGDGKDPLDSTTVPAVLRTHIVSASNLCEDLGAVVVAAQLKVESDFDVNKVGTDGKQGVSQLPPEMFKKYGKDDDSNGKTSPLDAADSIMAQGRYMCFLFEQVKPFAVDDPDKPQKSKLSLALAAYHVGLDPVLEAKGMPPGVEANSYVAHVRTYFPQYMGILPPMPPPKSPMPSFAPPTSTPR